MSARDGNDARVISVYEVTSNQGNINEPDVSEGYFATEAAADTSFPADAKSYYRVTRHRAIRFADNSVWLLGDEIDVASSSNERVRKQALAKLTPAERKALGL